MYAQNPRSQQEDLTLPQNYSGTAFRYPPIGSLRDHSPPPMPARPDRPTESLREGGASLFGGMAPSASSVPSPPSSEEHREDTHVQEEHTESQSVPRPSSQDSTDSTTSPPSHAGNITPPSHGFHLPSLWHGEPAEDDLLLLGLLLLLTGNNNRDRDEKNSTGNIITCLLLLLLCG